MLYFKEERTEFTPYSEIEIEKYKQQKAFAAYYTNFTGEFPKMHQIRAGVVKAKTQHGE